MLQLKGLARSTLIEQQEGFFYQPPLTKMEETIQKGFTGRITAYKNCGTSCLVQYPAKKAKGMQPLTEIGLDRHFRQGLKQSIDILASRH